MILDFTCPKETGGVRVLYELFLEQGCEPRVHLTGLGWKSRQVYLMDYRPLGSSLGSPWGKNPPAKAGESGSVRGFEWPSTPVCLPGKSHGQGDFQAAVHGGGCGRDGRNCAATTPGRCVEYRL